jgi:hypothetical protein
MGMIHLIDIVTDTQWDELPMEKIPYHKKESHGIANPWAIPNHVFEM